MLDARSYAVSLAALTLTTPADVTGKYIITTTSDMTTTPPSYLITAAPQGGQLSNDTRCGTLTLNQLGIKTRSGTASAVSDCW